MKKILIAVAALVSAPAVMAAGGTAIKFDYANNNIRDNASLQRGAVTYSEYCLGCHEAKFVRYKRAAQDLGVPADEFLKHMKAGKDVTPGDMMTNAFPKDKKDWFGKVPPDLSLAARRHSPDWLYMYLRSFYNDPSKPLGTNNAVLADAGMPHVFLDLQGVQEPIFANCLMDGKPENFSDKYKKKWEKAQAAIAKGEEPEYTFSTCGPKTVVDFELVKPGTLTPEQFDNKVRDLVNFMDYMAEPQKRERIDVGIRVMLMLLVFAVVAFLLKREYWRDVH